MTDKQRTPAEVNAKLAKGDGWTKHKYSPVHDKVVWYPPGDRFGENRQADPPDYCGDWKYTGPMLVELLEWHGRMEFGHKFFMVHLAKHGRHNGKSLTEAISRAELARREGEG